MSPEMIIGKGYGFEVDFWHLGLLLYELACEYFPFQKKNNDPLMIYEQILKEEIYFPNSLELGCAQLLKRLLNKSKYERMGGGIG